MMYLVRGLPGSGKSTYAKQLDCFHVEADMYFYHNGLYIFNPNQIKQAHEWCYNTAKEAVSKGMDVVVSNTFTKIWEIEKYLEFDPKVYVCTGEFKNIHKVPEDVIARMKDRWEDYPGETIVRPIGLQSKEKQIGI